MKNKLTTQNIALNATGELFCNVFIIIVYHIIYYGCFRRNQLGRRSNQFLDVESHGIMGSYIPHRHRLRWLGDMARGILLTGCDPGMLGCLVWQI